MVSLEPIDALFNDKHFIITGDLRYFTKNIPIRQQNVPYHGQLNIRSTRKNIWGTKSSRGGAKKLEGALKKRRLLKLFLKTVKFVGRKKIRSRVIYFPKHKEISYSLE